MNQIFNELFVLEMTNNHQGDIRRGLRIIEEHSAVASRNGIRAAIKVQLREIDSFIHPDYKKRLDIRYVRRITETRLDSFGYKELINSIISVGCIPMATPFDEVSVDFCQELELPIIKVASASSNDWPLLKKIAQIKKPVIVSVAGLSIIEIDNLVNFFLEKSISLAINHCVAAYPAKDSDLQLDQIDFLKLRYPNVAIGLSSHEYNDWTSSVQIAYAKGARLFERHIDIESPQGISRYSSTPEKLDLWFKAFLKAKEMCGNNGNERAVPNEQEIEFIQSYTRGVYARRSVPVGKQLDQDDCYYAIPLLPNQISSKEIIFTYLGKSSKNNISKDSPILKSDFD